MALTEENTGSIKNIFKHLFIGTFGLTGLNPVEPFIVYGAKRMNDNQKIESTNEFRNYRRSLPPLVSKKLPIQSSPCSSIFS